MINDRKSIKRSFLAVEYNVIVYNINADFYRRVIRLRLQILNAMDKLNIFASIYHTIVSRFRLNWYPNFFTVYILSKLGGVETYDQGWG